MKSDENDTNDSKNCKLHSGSLRDGILTRIPDNTENPMKK